MELYDDARILPCGKRTCAAHIGKMIVPSNSSSNNNNNNHNSLRKRIKCHFCEEIHNFPENADNEFPVDKSLVLLLESMYGREHCVAKKKYNEAMQLIDKLVQINSTEDYVFDFFERVEADILLAKGKVKLFFCL